LLHFCAKKGVFEKEKNFYFSTSLKVEIRGKVGKIANYPPIVQHRLAPLIEMISLLHLPSVPTFTMRMRKFQLQNKLK